MNEIKQAVTKELINSVSENIELTGVRVLKGMDIVRNGEDYSIDSLAMGSYNGRNKVAFSVKLFNSKMEQKTVVVEASYDILVDVFVTSRPIAGGTVLTEDDFYPVKQKITKLPAGVVSNKRDIEGKILKSSLGQGIVIKSDYLAGQANIKKGQRVKVIVEGGGVTISTQGMLRGDTVVGGSAKVLCDVSKKELNGMLVSSNIVKVKI